MRSRRENLPLKQGSKSRRTMMRGDSLSTRKTKCCKLTLNTKSLKNSKKLTPISKNNLNLQVKRKKESFTMSLDLKPLRMQLQEPNQDRNRRLEETYSKKMREDQLESSKRKHPSHSRMMSCCKRNSLSIQRTRSL